MRPLSIELEGFFAYRKRALVQLTDVDYFSLEGPTGSGKSSLIDAMIFALYGKIPRLGGNTVAPAISAGAERARVSFRFLADDVVYTVTRQLERAAAGGARATEVRLETEAGPVASGSSDVTPEVTRLLNLSYEDFTRTVVLPQGEFARFLTATPKERQELLRGLLGLDVYRAMGSLARARNQVALSQMSSASSRLDRLAVPTDEERALAETRLEAIVALSEEVDRIEARFQSLNGLRDDLAKQIDQAVDAQGRLEKLAAPPDIEELSALLTKAADTAEQHSARFQELEKQSLEAVSTLEQLSSRESLQRVADGYERLDSVDAELAAIDLESARAELTKAENGVAAAGEELELAVRSRDEARKEHAAHDIARQIEPGDACPVCMQVVARIPDRTVPVDLDATEKAMIAAAGHLEKMRALVGSLSTGLAREEAAHSQLALKRNELADDLSDAPAREDVPGLIRQFEEASQLVAEIEEQKRRVSKLIAASEEEQARLAEQQRTLGKTLMSEREKLADLKPPIAESEDIVIQWKELLSWREVTVGETTEILTGLRGELEETRNELSTISADLDTKLRSLGIAAGERSPSVALARAEERAKQTLEEQRAAVEMAAGLREEIEKAAATAAVAETLAKHLRADGFERWMMVGAIADLVAGANSILEELSRSSYSLHSDEDGSFDIVDHRNADEIRPVATLSGGETFLVSLALALSLAETLAAAGGSKLDAIILDEGFGTLDDESLDVVASVLEKLTMSGLMVGIITHVKALAHRAPVRFVVEKGPEGSSVEVAE
jgi:DNA repair protein SbcC/Rad50